MATHWDEDIRAAERDLQKWTRRNERLTAIYVQGIIDQDEYEHQRRFVREPQEAAEERLRRLRVQKERADAAVDMMAAFKASAAEYLESLGVDPKTGEPSSDGGPLDVEGRKQVIRDVVESATIDADNQLRYQLRVPDLTKVAITSSTPAWPCRRRRALASWKIARISRQESPGRRPWGSWPRRSSC